MNIRRPVFFMSLLFVFITYPSPSFASHESPISFVKSIVDQCLGILKSESNKDAQKEKILNLINNSFDFPHITDVMFRGINVSDSEKSAFTELFPALLQMRYSIFVRSPDSLIVEYLRYEVFAGETNAVVYTRTKIPSHDMALSYKLRHADGKWKIQDIAVGGISLIDNYRAQVHQVLKRKEFPELLSDLERIVKRNAPH